VHAQLPIDSLLFVTSRHPLHTPRFGFSRLPQSTAHSFSLQGWREDTADDMREAAAKHGPVSQVVVDGKSPRGLVYVAFGDVGAAIAAATAIAGRSFGGRGESGWRERGDGSGT
jgi:hypothetical protein